MNRELTSRHVENQKGEVLNMNRELTSRHVEYPEIEKDDPKNLKSTDTRIDPKERLPSIHGYPGSRSKDRVDAENLEDLLPRFIAEVVRVKYEYVSENIMEEIIVLKNVRMHGSGILFESYLCLPREEWARTFRAGDMIAFSARVKNATLEYPTEATLI